MNKKRLEIIISQLSDYFSKHPSLEQYTTPVNIASNLLWNAYMNGDIEGKKIIDLGCGNGILGISALLLGAKKVIFIDKDEKAIEVTKKNCESLQLKNYELIHSDIVDYNKKADIVLMNPPFGVQTKKADVTFLKHSITLGKKIYLIYKGDGLKVIKKELPNKTSEILEKTKLILKKQFSFHKKQKKETEIILIRIS